MKRAAAFVLLTEYIKDLGLVRHCLSVEAAMRA
jgi:predicted hydrolase (HD superfamily)